MELLPRTEKDLLQFEANAPKKSTFQGSSAKIFAVLRRIAGMKEKDRYDENTSESSQNRPKLTSLDGNLDNPTSTPKIRRIAQPGDVLFPRAVAYRTDLTLSARMVALWLYDHLAPGTNVANGSQDLIGEELGLCLNTVLKALDELWKNRIITKIERKNKKGGGFYLCYGMQMFPSDSPRVNNRPRKQRVKQLNQHTNQDKKERNVKSNTQEIKKADENCSKCYGSGWEFLPKRQGARRCDCIK